MPRDTLSESAQVTLDGSGNGAIVIGPVIAAQTWIPTMIGVQVSTNVKEPLFKLYRGRTVGALGYLNGTSTGSNDSTDVNGIVLHPGETFLGVWTGGDAGAIASISINGELQYD